MKVCLINNLFSPYERGGAEKIVLYIKNSLKEKNVDFVLISSAPFFRDKKNDVSGVCQVKN